MNPIDAPISQFFSSLEAQHRALTSVFSVLANSYFFRGQIIFLMFWWVWFTPGEERVERRRVLVAALVACLIGLAVGRVMVSTLPLRLRPSENSAFHFSVPALSRPGAPESSFPSDHAILFVALASGMFLASRRVGSLALAYVTTLICFPRLWLGFHFFTDLLAGAVIGAGLVLLFNHPKLRAAVSGPLLSLLETKPHLFYAALFLLSYQVAAMFDPLRDFLAYLHHHVVPLAVSFLGH